jgi:hypothetical protein
MTRSTSIDKKSKDKDFVANEVSESSSESNEVITRYTTNKETIQNSSFFLRSILQVEFSHVYSLCNI